MNHYIITTESGSDLPKEYVERFNVKIIPMHVTMGNETLPDGSFEVKKAFPVLNPSMLFTYFCYFSAFCVFFGIGKPLRPCSRITVS